MIVCICLIVGLVFVVDCDVVSLGCRCCGFIVDCVEELFDIGIVYCGNVDCVGCVDGVVGFWYMDVVGVGLVYVVWIDDVVCVVGGVVYFGCCCVVDCCIV